MDTLRAEVRRIFEVSADIVQIAPGSLEREFQSQVKQKRFVDQRG